MSPPVRGAWVEIWITGSTIMMSESPPVRGAWVEILLLPKKLKQMLRRPLCGGRGLKYFSRPDVGPLRDVAPCAGGVG